MQEKLKFKSSRYLRHKRRILHVLSLIQMREYRIFFWFIWFRLKIVKFGICSTLNV